MWSVLPACGGNDGAQVFQVGRYCDLASQFEGIALASGASSAPGRYDGPPEAIDRLLDQMGPTVDELQATAPPELREDVEVVLDGLRTAGGGDTSGTQSARFLEANERIESFRQASCQGSGSSGEQ